MNVRNLFYSSYWFNQPVIANRGVYYFWLIGLLAIFAVGLGSLIYRNFSKDRIMQTILKKVGDLGTNMGVSGLILFSFRQQSVPVLGLRFWFLIWFIVFAVWLGFLLKYIIKRVPVIRKEQAERERFEKYLPQTK